MQKLAKIRLIGWILASAVLLAILMPNALHLFAVDLHKMSLVTIGAVMAYWLDRSLFPYARPDRMTGVAADQAMIRRAIIVAAVILGMSLGA